MKETFVKVREALSLKESAPEEALAKTVLVRVLMLEVRWRREPVHEQRMSESSSELRREVERMDEVEGAPSHTLELI